MHWLTKSKNKKGVSLVEVILAVGIFVIISGGLLLIFNIGLKMTRDAKARAGALVVANQKMETVKNLPYDDIGTVGGIPVGDLDPTETVSLNNIDYTANTNIIYIDDDYDDLAPTDLLNIDYKQIRIEVDWVGQIGQQPITLITNIAPPGLEQEPEGETGTLWIEVYDSEATELANATVSIVNNDLPVPINIITQTNDQGLFILPGAPISIQNYEITITKNDYSTDQTYSVDILNNPNPNPAHLSVGVGEVTTKSFFIDRLCTLNITAKEHGTDTVIPSLPFILQGEKTIGYDGEGAPVFKYDEELTTDGSGIVNLTDMEYDIYSFDFNNTATGYDLSGSSEFLPLVLAPNTTMDLTLWFAPHADHTLLLHVKDTSSEPLLDAVVRLYKADLSYDQTYNTNEYGQVFYTPLDSDTYNLEITKSGYITYTQQIDVENQNMQDITMVAL